MKILQRTLIGTAICAVLFAIGCIVYVQFDKQHPTEDMESLRPLSPTLLDTPKAEDTQAQPAEPVTDGDVAPAENRGKSYDWLNDDAEVPHRHNTNTDPWQVSSEQTDTAEVDTEATDTADVYPPIGWHRTTTDPDQYTEYFRAQLIKQFGDVPQAAILAEGNTKVRFQIPMTLDEKIEHLEAMNDLFPHPKTAASIEFWKEWRASGRTFEANYGPAQLPTDDFLDAKTFVERYGWEEGLAKFKEAHPARAEAFERMRKAYAPPPVD